MGGMQECVGIGNCLRTFVKTGVLTCLVFGLFLVISPIVFALQPPRPGEIEQLKQEGRYEEQLAKAVALGNHLIDPDLLEQALYKVKRQAEIQQGVETVEIQAAVPSGRKLMPTKGSVKVFALLIDFPDYPFDTGGYSTQSQIQSAIFGNGSEIPGNTLPYESLNNFYERSSYNQLHFSGGTTLGWYRAGYNRSTVPQTTAGREALIKEALEYFDDSVDFSQFNNDTTDSKIESFIVIWTGPNNGWSNFWWAYQTGWIDSTYTIDGMKLGKYIWQWAGDYGTAGPFEPYVAIHEMGHVLGLPDYYDYDSAVGPKGGVGGLDMMHGNWGDHNGFSKWVLDWLTPTVVASGSQTLTLNPSGTTTDAVVIMPGATTTDAFREFYVAQNRYRVGNDPAVNNSAGNKYPTDGMLIWHVDARLNSAGTDFKYDNSYTSRKLIKLMQADGLDRIENSSATADASMYYKTGKILTPVSIPNSRDNSGVDTRVNVSGISQSAQQMTATFSIDAASTLATLTVVKAGNGSGTVAGNNAAEISCGADCAESYVPVNGTIVTLTATAVPGSVFAGWSGGGCSGTGTCTVTMTTNVNVTATFTTTLVLDEDFDPVSSNPPSSWTTVKTYTSGSWWFSSPGNSSGGNGYRALGAGVSGKSAPYDVELRTSQMNLSSYSSVGLEFKTYVSSSDPNVNVDLSFDGGTTWPTTVWSKPVSGFSGAQTVIVDLTSTAAGHSNVILRFRTWGNSIWLELDDIKVMAVTPVVSTSTTVVANLSPTTYGQPVTFTATIAPASAAGTVTFYNGASYLDSTAVSSGSANYSTSALSVGSHSIISAYGGNSSYSSSISPAISQTVNPATLSVTAAAKSKIYGNADPALTYTVTGLVNGDTAAVMSGSLTRTAGEAAGTYAILQGGVSGGANYTIAYAGANLTIIAAVVRETILNQPAVNFATLASAVSAVPDDGAATLQLLNGDLNEKLNIADSVDVILVGGYDNNLALQLAEGITRLQGPLIVSKGKLAVSGVALH